MSKINFIKKKQQNTDYNYSFCDESERVSNKQNYCSNTALSLHSRLDGLQKLIRKQFNMQNKDDKIIRQQAAKLNRMTKCIEEINHMLQYERKTYHQSHHQISSISKPSKEQDSSIFTYSNNNSHNRQSLEKHSKNSNKLHSYQRSSVRHSSNRIKSEASKYQTNKTNLKLSKSVRKELLHKIVQRKHIIQKCTDLIIKNSSKDQTIIRGRQFRMRERATSRISLTLRKDEGQIKGK